MRKWLYPKMYLSSLFDLDPEILRKKDIKAILLDLDNTIVRRDSQRFEPAVEKWLKDLRDQGFSLAIVSNNSPERVNSLAGPLNIPTVSRAVKPMKQAFWRALNLLGARPEHTAVLGDQIFTDILGGNRLGLFTILVVPLKGKEFWATRIFNRRMEKLILMDIKRKTAGKTGCILLD